MDLVLYVADPSSVAVIGASPPSWMCEAVLAAKGLAHRRVALSFARGEHRSPSMLARNPRGTIPVLMDGEAVVHETFAILLYAESLAPGLVPAPAAARARALTRLFEAEHLKSAGMKALAYLMRTPEHARDVDALRAHGAELRAELDRWQLALAEGYAAGPSMTLADFAVYPYVETLAHLGLSLEPWPNVAAHRDRMAALDAIATTRPPAWGEPAATDPWDAGGSIHSSK